MILARRDVQLGHFQAEDFESAFATAKEHIAAET